MSKLQMKKLAVAVAALGAVAMGSDVAQAANSTNGTFLVNITLTSACQVGAITPVAFAYTSLGGAAVATGGNFNVTCTATLPYTFGLVAGTGGSAPGTSTIAVTDSIVNLAYTLGTSAAGATGNASAQPFTVTGNMIAGQAGTCASGTCNNTGAANATQTLFINW